MAIHSIRKQFEFIFRSFRAKPSSGGGCRRAWKIPYHHEIGLGSRARNGLFSWWCVESDETIEEPLVREMKEELDVVVVPVECLWKSKAASGIELNWWTTTLAPVACPHFLYQGLWEYGLVKVCLVFFVLPAVFC